MLLSISVGDIRNTILLKFAVHLKPMEAEDIRTYCLQKPEVSEHFPFDDVTLVFKVKGKIFALCALDAHPLWINLKCDPERSAGLREHHPAIIPGYHMNKVHWNTIILDGSLPAPFILGLIDHSYDLVSASIKGKSKRNTVKK